METNIQTEKQIDKLRQTKKTAQNIKLNVNTELSFVTVQIYLGKIPLIPQL